MPHGGPRTPSEPAAVSGPGALSQRTDGGPAAGRISGQPYGQGAQANQLLQQAGQTAGGSPATAPNAPQQGPQAAPGQPLPDVFAPTNRPGEPITQPAPTGPADFADDPDELLRTLIGLAPDAHSRDVLLQMWNT